MKKETLSRRAFLKLTGVTAAIPTSLVAVKAIIPKKTNPSAAAFEGPLTEEMLIEKIGISNTRKMRMYADEEFMEAMGKALGDKLWYVDNPQVHLIERI